MSCDASCFISFDGGDGDICRLAAILRLSVIGAAVVAIVAARTTIGWTNCACNLHHTTFKVTWSKVVYFNHLQVHPSPDVPSPLKFLNRNSKDENGRTEKIVTIVSLSIMNISLYNPITKMSEPTCINST